MKLIRDFYFCFREELSKLFVNLRGLGASSFGGSLVGIEGSQSLRRASSIRRTCTAGTAGIKRKSVCLQVSFTIRRHERVCFNFAWFLDEIYDRRSRGDPTEDQVEIRALPPATAQRRAVRNERLAHGSEDNGTARRFPDERAAS